MIRTLLILFGITLLPAFELRASIPCGILTGSVTLPFGWEIQGMALPWNFVFGICVLSNILLGIMIYPLFDRFLHLLDRIPIIGRLHERWKVRAQTKLQRYIDRWGIAGLTLFVAIPLPGSGSYTGALGAVLLGINYRAYIIANSFGVTLAGIAVTLMTLSGMSLWKLLS